MSESVVIETYDAAWPARFESARRVLAETLAPVAPRIEHVGSTAVPGLVAKPIVDVLLGVDALAAFDPFIPALEAAGWRYHPEHEAILPERRFFGHPADPPRALHLHVALYGGDFWERHLRFRDRLRADPALARDYADLKQALARRHRADREAYTEAKGAFIRAALEA